MKIDKLTILCLLLFSTSNVVGQIRAKDGKGYFNITNIAEPQYLQSIDSSNLTYASGHIKSFGFSANTISGAFLNNNLSIGLGLGLQFTGYKAYKSEVTPDSTFAEGYFTDRHSMTLLPIFADFRYYPKGYKHGLMVVLDVGYAPLLKIKHKFDKANLDGGAMLKLGAAYRLPLSETISFIPSVNFNAQRFGNNTGIGASVGLGMMF